MVLYWWTPQICLVITLLQVLSQSELSMVVILNRCLLNLSLSLSRAHKHKPHTWPGFVSLSSFVSKKWILKNDNWCFSPLVISCWRQLIVLPGNIHNTETLSNLDDWDTAGGDFFKSAWDPKEMNTSVAHFCLQGASSAPQPPTLKTFTQRNLHLHTADDLAVVRGFWTDSWICGPQTVRSECLQLFSTST